MEEYRVFKGNQIDAEYLPTEEVEAPYRHNPYIECLPPLFTERKVASLIRRKPYYSESQRLISNERRVHAVQTLDNWIEPLPLNVSFEARFSTMLRNGYSTRNPISAAWIRQMREGYPSLDWDAGYKGYVPYFRDNPSGMGIVGTSGWGKSTMVESILGLYPQVINHTEYKEMSFDRRQLVWLKLECPWNGHPRALCRSFFYSIDEILGTNFYKTHDKKTASDYLDDIAYHSLRLGLGVLVIDEIQRLIGGEQQLMDFFIQLQNSIGIPTIMIGTFKARNLFKKELACAKRISGQGAHELVNLAKDEVWDFFLKNMWEFQWTNVKSPLTPKINEVMYEESQGIPGFAVNLYKLIQWELIGNENEEITPDTIRIIAKERLKFVKPILDALREKDYAKLEGIKDVYTEDMDRYFHLTIKRVSTITLDKIRESDKEEEDSPFLKIVRVLLNLGVELKTAEESARKALESKNGDLILAMKTALAEVLKTGEPKQLEGRTTNRTNNFVEGDLRAITGNKKGKSKALKDAGIIKSMEEFV